MVINKTPLFETNFAVSEFIPSVPIENPALQGTTVPNAQFDGVTLQDMRDNAVLYDKSHADLDKISLVQQTLRQSAPEVQKAADNLKQAQQRATKPRI